VSQSLSIRSRLLHFTSSSPLEWEYFEDGILLIEQGLIKDIGPAERFIADGFDMAQCEHRPGKLLIPGMIDTHVHSPQIDIIGSYGEQLLDWLNKYTFPAEAKFADAEYARQGAEVFINSLLEHGTTSAMVFATSHEGATDALFAAAQHKGMRLIAGKVLMDQNALPDLLDTAQTGYEDSESLIRKWHGKGRLGYAITPRFAGCSSPEQLAGAGRLHKAYPDTWVQTHLSENLDEIAWVRSVHPDASDYLDAYERHGLHTDRSIFAHCLHLTDDEFARLGAGGGRVAFCPTSNLFLGSGLFDLEKFNAHDIPVSIATDVGAGTSLSMLKTLGEAYKVCQLRGQSLGPMQALCMATLMNAEALHLDSFIGNFLPGKEADFVVLDPEASSLIARRTALAETIADELFVYLTLGDDRVIQATYVAGELQFSRGDH
jgi:guanine deaminase